MNIIAQADASKGTFVALTIKLGITPSTLNTVVKNRKGSEQCYA
jgi:hypothetical protein